MAAARRRAGWSLAQLAERSRLSRGYLCRLEHGLRAPSVITVGRLVEALPLSADESDVVVRAGLPGVGRDWRPNGQPPAALHERESRYPVTDHRPGRERNMLDTITQCWGGRT